jgi:hypothetical protein
MCHRCSLSLMSCSTSVVLWQVGTESSTNPFSNEFALPAPVTKLNLRSYIVKGYPCTAGVPNDTHFIVQMSTGSVSNAGSTSWISPSGPSGIKLFLESGGFTHHHTAGNTFVGNFGQLRDRVKLDVKVLAPDGSNATYSSLWLVFEIPSQ